MYEAFYGLKEKAFNLNPDPEYFYMSREHENAYVHLEYAIRESKGFAVITGEIGSGKTTLINYLLYKLKLDINIGLITNTNIPASQFLKAICREFEIDVDVREKVDIMEIFQDFLLERYAHNERVLLIIDEAQNISPEAMEEIRMLSNLEAEKSHLIQIILIGQPELKNKLQRNDLKQFAQRVSSHYHINGLSKVEVNNYIRYRLKVGEAKNPDIFKKDAIELIYKHSLGIPRIINVLCDTSLVYGYADGQKTIDKKIIDNVIKERDESGIFSGLDIDSPSPISVKNDLPEEKGLNINNAHLQMMENRIDSLEATISGLQEKVQNLNHLKNKRDDTIIELLKMLEQSMKSRMKLLSLVSSKKNLKDSGNIKEPETKSQKISLAKK
jgi:general secretion pathway protein A